MLSSGKSGAGGAVSLDTSGLTDATLKTNVYAPFWLTKAAVTRMQAGGVIVNTSSEAGIAGPVGQANYGAAKAGITALTLSAARGLSRYGVRANAIAPRARTAMTAGVFGEAPELGDGEVDALSPEHVVTLVTYLSSPAAKDVNGQLFIVYGPTVTLVAAPVAAERFEAAGAAWDPAALSATLGDFFAERDPNIGFSATELMGS